MIVARICKPNGGEALVNVGSVRISPYDGKADGWFPIDSFNFGFVEKPDKEEDDGKQGAHGAPSKGGTGAHSAAPTPSPGGKTGKGGKGKDLADLSFTKQVDSVSSSLMFLAMQARQNKKGLAKDQEIALEADIHVVSSLQTGLKGDRYTYTSLMIHLEAVNVLSWDVSASGDSRPTETVKLRYDRAAMLYVATSDGKVFRVGAPKGWDQTKNEEFKWDTAKVEKYYPPLETRVK